MGCTNAYLLSDAYILQHYIRTGAYGMQECKPLLRISAYLMVARGSGHSRNGWSWGATDAP